MSDERVSKEELELDALMEKVAIRFDFASGKELARAMNNKFVAECADIEKLRKFTKGLIAVKDHLSEKLFALREQAEGPAGYRWHQRGPNQVGWQEWHVVGHKPQGPKSDTFDFEPLYAAPPAQPGAVSVPMELLVAAKSCVQEMRDENKLHGHITDASAKWAIYIEPQIDSALAAAPRQPEAQPECPECGFGQGAHFWNCSHNQSSAYTQPAEDEARAERAKGKKS